MASDDTEEISQPALINKGEQAPQQLGIHQERFPTTSELFSDDNVSESSTTKSQAIEIPSVAEDDEDEHMQVDDTERYQAGSSKDDPLVIEDQLLAD